MNEENAKNKKIEVVTRQQMLGKEFNIYGTVEEPLFLAKDVAKWIEHSDVSMMLKSVDEDEKLIQTMLVSGQNRECMFLTENGVYEVLMLSRKPVAKQFKKEVKRILHELRVNGAVVSTKVALATPEEQMASFQRAIDNAVQHAMELADNYYLPKIKELNQQKAWISNKQIATAMATASAKARMAKRLEHKVAELEAEIDVINSIKDVYQSKLESYKKLGRSLKSGNPRGNTEPLI